MAFSSFRGVPFDWEFGGPQQSVQDGAYHLQGSIVVYSKDNLDSLFTFRRPCTVRAAGDPTANGMVYVDHWGPDPSGPLTMHVLMPAVDPEGKPSIEPTPFTYTAILNDLTRNTAQPLMVHMATADFILLQNVVFALPSQIGTLRTGQSGDQAAPPDTGAGSGSRVEYAMGTNMTDTSVLSLWDWDSSSNFEPPEDWQQPGFDDNTWSLAVEAEGAVPAPLPQTWNVWAASGPAGENEEVLLRQLFTPSAGTIVRAVVRAQMDEHMTGLWINGFEVGGVFGVNYPTTFEFDPSMLVVGENLFAASCAAAATSPDKAYMDFRVELTYE